MKNKHKRQFLSHYKWWDYSFLLDAMSDWLSHASKQTHNKGTHLNAHKTAKRMQIAGELCKRIKDYHELNHIYCILYPEVFFDFVEEPIECDDLSYNCVITYFPDEVTYKRVNRLLRKQQQRQLAEMKQMLFKILDKHLLNMWD